VERTTDVASPRRVGREQRREQLVAAALAVLVEDGPGAVTTRRVAERAGAPLATVHYVFRDKDELLQAAAGEVMASFAAALQDRIRPELGLRQALADSLEGYWQWIRANEAMSTAAMETFIASLRAGTVAAMAVTGVLAVLTAHFEQAAAHDGRQPRTPLPEIARLVLIAGEGLALVYLAQRDPAASEADLITIRTALQGMV
jgi:AcrR family transcriptional regulator